MSLGWSTASRKPRPAAPADPRTDLRPLSCFAPPPPSPRLAIADRGSYPGRGAATGANGVQLGPSPNLPTTGKSPAGGRADSKQSCKKPLIPGKWGFADPRAREVFSPFETQCGKVLSEFSSQKVLLQQNLVAVVISHNFQPINETNSCLKKEQGEIYDPGGGELSRQALQGT